MKNTELLEAIGGVDARWLTDVEQAMEGRAKPRRKAKKLGRTLLLAAALTALLGVSAYASGWFGLSSRLIETEDPYMGSLANQESPAPGGWVATNGEADSPEAQASLAWERIENEARQGEHDWKAADAFTAGFEDCWKFRWKPLPPGTEVSYGDYHLKTVPLPGHTVGHMGLWEEKKKVLFSGDVLVHGVTPIVSDSGNYPNALDDYLDSLRAVKHKYADCLFIPGHGKPFRHPEEEVDCAVQNYLDKCSIMYDILRHTEGPLSIRGVAMRAYGRYGKHLTDEQRSSCILIWFKTSACLQYMQERDLVKETVEDGVSLWTAVRASGT